MRGLEKNCIRWRKQMHWWSAILDRIVGEGLLYSAELSLTDWYTQESCHWCTAILKGVGTYGLVFLKELSLMSPMECYHRLSLTNFYTRQTCHWWTSVLMDWYPQQSGYWCIAILDILVTDIVMDWYPWQNCHCNDGLVSWRKLSLMSLIECYPCQSYHLLTAILDKVVTAGLLPLTEL